MNQESCIISLLSLYTQISLQSQEFRVEWVQWALWNMWVQACVSHDQVNWELCSHWLESDRNRYIIDFGPIRSSVTSNWVCARPADCLEWKIGTFKQNIVTKCNVIVSDSRMWNFQWFINFLVVINFDYCFRYCDVSSKLCWPGQVCQGCVWKGFPLWSGEAGGKV